MRRLDVNLWPIASYFRSLQNRAANVPFHNPRRAVADTVVVAVFCAWTVDSRLTAKKRDSDFRQWIQRDAELVTKNAVLELELARMRRGSGHDTSPAEH